MKINWNIVSNFIVQSIVMENNFVVDLMNRQETTFDSDLDFMGFSDFISFFYLWSFFWNKITIHLQNYITLSSMKL